MNLGFVISVLEKAVERAGATAEVSPGFGVPDSYRGYYEQLAFAPKESATLGAMLYHARSAVGRTFEGYKGGEFLMNRDTICVVAEYGCSSSDDSNALASVLIAVGGAVAAPTFVVGAKAQWRDTQGNTRPAVITEVGPDYIESRETRNGSTRRFSLWPNGEWQCGCMTLLADRAS
jgi:hypothetical protein